MANPMLMSAARGKITYIDGSGNQRILAFALDISVSEAVSNRKTYCIGSLNPLSIDPTGIDVTASISRVVPVNDIDSEELLQGKTSSADLGLNPKIQDILTSQTIAIELLDKVTDKIICGVREARFAGRSLGVNAQGVATERLNFTGIFDPNYSNSNTGVKLGYGPASA
jgi:hypothetical protein